MAISYKIKSFTLHADVDPLTLTEWFYSAHFSGKGYFAFGANSRYVICYPQYDASTYIKIKTSSDGHTWTQRLSLTDARAGAINYCASIKTNGDGYVYVAFAQDDAGTRKLKLYRSNDETTWALYKTISITNLETVLELVYIGSVWYALVNRHSTSTTTLYWYDLTNETAAPITTVTTVAATNQVSPRATSLGFLYGGKAYFAYNSAANHVTFAYFDGAAVTTVYDITLASATVLSYKSALVWKNSGVLFLAGDSKVWTLPDFWTSDEKQVSAYDYFRNPVLMMMGVDAGLNYTSSMLIFMDTAYGVNSFGITNQAALVKREVFTAASNPTGKDNFIMYAINEYMATIEKVFYRQPATTMLGAAYASVNFSPDSVKFYSDQFKGQRVSFVLNPDDGYVIAAGQYLEVYADATLLCDGAYDLDKTEPADGIYVVVDGSEKDFSRKVTVSWTADKSHEMLQSLLDTFCHFLDGTIADDSFADWAYSAKDVEVRKIIQDIMNHDYHLFRHLSTDACSFIADPLAGAAALTLNSANMGDPAVRQISYPIAEVRLTGKWVAASADYLRSKWLTTETGLPSQNILSDAFPYIDSQTDLDNQAAQIGAMRKNQVQMVSVEVYGESSLYQYGQVVEVCYPLKGIGTENAAYEPVTYDNYMITRSALNDDGFLFLELISAFIFTRGREAIPASLVSIAKDAALANERVEKLAAVASTISTTYLPLAGGTMGGAIAMGTNKITGIGNGADAQDAVSKAQLDLKADINNPTLTGTPAAPTAAAGTSTTQIATTAFVMHIPVRIGFNLMSLNAGATIGPGDVLPLIYVNTTQDVSFSLIVPSSIDVTATVDIVIRFGWQVDGSAGGAHNQTLIVSFQHDDDDGVTPAAADHIDTTISFVPGGQFIIKTATYTLAANKLVVGDVLGIRIYGGTHNYFIYQAYIKQN